MSHLFLTKKKKRKKWDFIIFSNNDYRPTMKYLGRLSEITDYGYLLKNGRKIFLIRGANN